jgi:hypothetical protein
MTTTYEASQVSAFVKKLVSEKCSNYGYDYKDFKRVSSQRSKARQEFMHFATYNMGTLIERISSEPRIQLEDVQVTRISESGLKIVSIEPRLVYVVGQSQNEEITNLMRRLVNPKAKWLK